MTNNRPMRASLLLSAAWFITSAASAQTPLSDPNAGSSQPGASAASADSPAQATNPGASSGGLEDIVVTARRTSERLQTTPVAVTALTANAIKEAQITDAVSIQRSVPSLSIATGSPGTSGFTFISIRGAGTQNPGVANDPSVATYVDGVYIPRPSQGVTDLLDLQRAEVLRGPQGTLFGRNTTGGALNIITADPSDKFEGQIRAQAGNYNYKNAGLILNAPIAAGLAARVVYDFTDRDGFGKNVRNGRELNDRNSHFVRGKLRWAPEDSDWSATLAGDFNRLKDHGQFVAATASLPGPPAVQFLKGVLPGGLGNVPGIIDFPVNLNQFNHANNPFYRTFNQPTAVTPPAGIRRNRATTQPFDYLKAYGGSLTIDGKLGETAVKSITAYRYSFSIGQNDLDGTPVDVLETQSYYLSRQLSHEVQFSGELFSGLNYIFGAYYSHETGAENSLSRTFGYSPVLAPAPNMGFALNYSGVTNNSAGVFGQVNYSITDKLRFTGGVRWTFDTRRVRLENLTSITPRVCSAELIALGATAAACALPRQVKYDYPAWTGSLDYKASDQLFVYIKSSGASKAGGFNLRNGSANTPPFKPEKVRDVESGLKFNTRDNRVRLNIAGFFSWQSDVQRNANGVVIVGGTATSTQFLQNAGKQHIYGAEFEGSVVPWTGMTLNANLALLYGQYVNGTFTETRDIPGVGLAGCTPTPGNPTASRCIVDRSGEPVPQKPRTQYSISATQVFPTGLGELSLHANYAYISHQFYDTLSADPREPAATQANEIRQNQLGRQPGYGLLDARAGLQLENPNVELFMFAKNITGKKYTTRPFNALYSSLGVAFEYIGNPFTFGGGATFRF